MIFLRVDSYKYKFNNKLSLFNLKHAWQVFPDLHHERNIRKKVLIYYVSVTIHGISSHRLHSFFSIVLTQVM